MKKINGDKIKGILSRIMYFFQCLLDQNKGKSKYIKIENPTLSISNINTFKKTPSRILCEAFWNSIDYENLEIQLKSKINFFDIGCGSGHHGIMYEKLCSNSFGSYTGLDVYKNARFPPKYFHVLDKAENVSNHINKKINFISSQSSLEHIEKDNFVIKQITKKLINNNSPFIQIHMIPAGKALWLYLWHGYRQYSKKNLANLASELKEIFNLNISLIPIGGSSSFWAHLKLITLPIYFGILLKNKNFKWFNQINTEKKLLNSISRELSCNSKSPVFWALIITSKNIKLRHKL